MHTDEEIKEKARNYWQHQINIIHENLVADFLAEAKAAGFDVNSKGITGIDIPDFKSLKVDLGRYSPKNKPLVKIILGDSALNYGMFFKTIPSGKPSSILVEGGLYPLVMIARTKTIEQHKEFRQKQNRLLSNLKKSKEKLPDRAPYENVMFYQEAIDRVGYLFRFSKSLIDYLEKEWLESFGFDENISKNPVKHPCWTPVIENAYDVLTKRAKPAFTHTGACTYIANLFSCVYPNIWSDPPKKVASAIRSKVDSLRPHLIKK